MTFNELIFDDVKLVDKGVKIKSEQMLKKGDILICAGSGSKDHIGKVAYIKEDMDYTFGGFMGVVRCDELVSSRYLFFILTSNIFIDYLSKELHSSTINNLNSSLMNKFQIPIPPLEVQAEVVMILDKFSRLTSELQKELDAELKARKLQYEYYRDQLLSFGTDDPTVQWLPLGEVAEFYGGLTGKTKHDFGNGNSKYVTYKNIYSNIEIDNNAFEYVDVHPEEKQSKIKYGDILVTGSSENLEDAGMTSAVTCEIKEDIYLNSFSFGIRFKSEINLIPEFAKYLFRCDYIRQSIKKTASGVTRYNVSKTRFKNIVIPIPPIEDQERIVGILDKFDKLTNSLTEGIPKEIEMRQLQYEYYRDALLSF